MERSITNWTLEDENGDLLTDGLEDPRVSDQAALSAIQTAERIGQPVFLTAAWKTDDGEYDRVFIEVDADDVASKVSNSLISKIGGNVMKARGFA